MRGEKLVVGTSGGEDWSWLRKETGSGVETRPKTQFPEGVRLALEGQGDRGLEAGNG